MVGDAKGVRYLLGPPEGSGTRAVGYAVANMPLGNPGAMVAMLLVVMFGQ